MACPAFITWLAGRFGFGETPLNWLGSSASPHGCKESQVKIENGSARTALLSGESFGLGFEDREYFDEMGELQHLAWAALKAEERESRFELAG